MPPMFLSPSIKEFAARSGMNLASYGNDLELMVVTVAVARSMALAQEEAHA